MADSTDAADQGGADTRGAAPRFDPEGVTMEAPQLSPGLPVPPSAAPPPPPHRAPAAPTPPPAAPPPPSNPAAPQGFPPPATPPGPPGPVPPAHPAAAAWPAPAAPAPPVATPTPAPGWPPAPGQAPPTGAPGWPASGSPAGWPAGPPPPASPTNRKPLFIGLAVLAVIAVAAIVFVMGFGRGGGGGGGGAASPGEAVKGYLEALSRGDAEAALAYSAEQPGSKDLLTDEILKQQIAQWPITNIRILSDESTPAISNAVVHVAANFGDKVSDTQLQLTRGGDGWLLKSAAVKLDPGSMIRASRTLTVFGKPVGEAPAYVFPGYLAFGSSNPYLNVSESQPVLLDGLVVGRGLFTAQFGLNQQGQQAALAAVGAAFDSCRGSRSLNPPSPCPIRVGANIEGYVDGTVQWGQPDLSGVRADIFNPVTMTVAAIGSVKIPFSAQDRTGAMRSTNAITVVNEKVDMSTNPPSVTPR